MKLKRYDYLAVNDLFVAAKSMIEYLEENSVYDCALDDGPGFPDNDVLMTGGTLNFNIDQMKKAIKQFE